MNTKYPPKPSVEIAGLNSWPSDCFSFFQEVNFAVLPSVHAVRSVESFNLGSVVCTPMDGTGFSWQVSCSKARTEGNLLLPGLIQQSKETQLGFVM